MNSIKSLQIRGGYESLDSFQSSVLEALRFPLIVLVVFIHSYGEASDNLAFNSLRCLMSHAIAHSAVPVFYVISGYYFFYHTRFDYACYLSKIKKRIRTLLVPYILWNTISIFCMSLAYICLHRSWGGLIEKLQGFGGWRMYWDSHVWGVCEDWLGHVIDPMYSGPYLFPLWFLRDLMVVSLLSPVIYFLIRKCGRGYLIVLFMLYISKVWLYLPGFSALAVLCFSLGAFFAIHGMNIIEKFYPYRYLTGIVYGVLLIAFVYTDVMDIHRYSAFIEPFMVIAGVVAFVNIATYLCGRQYVKVSSSLSGSVFFIYVLHVIYVLKIVRGVMGRLIPDTAGWLLCSIRYLLVPLICVAICYVIYRLVMRYLPSCGKWLTGGR
jgi:hypothetical protein